MRLIKLVMPLLAILPVPANAYDYIEYTAFGSGSYPHYVNGNFVSYPITGNADIVIPLFSQDNCYDTSRFFCEIIGNKISIFYDGSYSSRVDLFFSVNLQGFPTTNQDFFDGDVNVPDYAGGEFLLDVTRLNVRSFSSEFANLGGLRTNFSVPESDIWAMMTVGFALVGAFLRNRNAISSSAELHYHL